MSTNTSPSATPGQPDDNHETSMVMPLMSSPDVMEFMNDRSFLVTNAGNVTNTEDGIPQVIDAEDDELTTTSGPAVAYAFIDTEDDILGAIDAEVSEITDAEIEARLRRTLHRAGYSQNLDAGACIDPTSSTQGDVLNHEFTRILGPELRQAGEIADGSIRQWKLFQPARGEVTAARQEAERIISAAREESERARNEAARILEAASEQSDQALAEAAKIVRDARIRADGIVSGALQVLQAAETARRTVVETARRQAEGIISDARREAELTERPAERPSSTVDRLSALYALCREEVELAERLTERPSSMADRLETLRRMTERHRLLERPSQLAGAVEAASSLTGVLAGRVLREGSLGAVDPSACSQRADSPPDEDLAFPPLPRRGRTRVVRVGAQGDSAQAAAASEVEVIQLGWGVDQQSKDGEVEAPAAAGPAVTGATPVARLGPPAEWAGPPSRVMVFMEEDDLDVPDFLK